MSLVLSLTSCAIVAGLTLSQTALMAVAVAQKEEEFDELDVLETQFIDADLLSKTLEGFDCHFQQVNENHFIVETACGNLIYKRNNVGEAFKLYLDEISDVEGLIENIKSFEVDYGKNVQAYTYDHIKKNLTDDMTIVDDEILEDDSLYLTINIE